MKNKLEILFLTLFALCLNGCNFKEMVHTHTFSSEWSYDETYHWHASTCEHDIKANKLKHNFDDKKQCTVCGYKGEEYIGPTPDPVDPVVEKVNITFDSNGGTGTMDSVELDKGSQYTLPVCGFTAPEGKEFDKWSIGETEYTVGTKITVDEDITVKALYREVHIDPVPAYIVVKEPTKLEYEAGDDLDLTGLVVTLYYDNGDTETINLNDISINGYNKDLLGEQTVTVSYLDFDETFKVTVIRKYNEQPDSLDGVDENDLSELYETFSHSFKNYTSHTESYFNDIGAYDYYRHYQKNYVQEKTNLYTKDIQYSYTGLTDYFDVLNKGYVNLNNNYYSYSLDGEDINARLNDSLTSDDLTLVKENSSYQDDLFTLDDINQEYLEHYNFVRVSEHKYQSTAGKDVYNDFISICAPQLINEGYYMTFSKVTIELNTDSMRIRLYASTTQSGKLLNIYKDLENRPNWYMLFSEAVIFDINQTTFYPTEGLLS